MLDLQPRSLASSLRFRVFGFWLWGASMSSGLGSPRDHGLGFIGFRVLWASGAYCRSECLLLLGGGVEVGGEGGRGQPGMI